jgi:hypothetical protein
MAGLLATLAALVEGTERAIQAREGASGYGYSELEDVWADLAELSQGPTLPDVSD